MMDVFTSHISLLFDSVYILETSIFFPDIILATEIRPRAVTGSVIKGGTFLPPPFKSHPLSLHLPNSQIRHPLIPFKLLRVLRDIILYFKWFSSCSRWWIPEADGNSHTHLPPQPLSSRPPPGKETHLKAFKDILYFMHLCTQTLCGVQ